MDAVMRQDGVRPVAEVLRRAKQLADAIDCAASAGVHHGMIAPCDVILDGERTGVTGSGLAQALIRAGIPAEAASPYGSPQRLAGALPTYVDDIYSLAAITLELLIGTPRDPEQDTSRALRQAQGLPERRRIPRPAPHETRLFTTIPGVDAGKLRAAFAAAFSEEPSERLSTASDFVARLQEAISNKRTADEPAPAAVAVPLVSDEPEDPPSAPVLNMKRAEDRPPLELSSRQERVVDEKRESKPESPVIRLEPIVDDALVAEVTLPRASVPVLVSNGKPVQPVSRAFVAAAVVTISFAAGFGGGFVVGHFSKPSTESIDVGHHEPGAQPRTARAVVEDPKPAAATTQNVAPVSEEKVSSSAPIAAVAREPAAPAADTGRLLVRSTPTGAGVVVDGQSRGVTPLALRDLAFGAHTIEVSHPDHNSRQRRVTLSERRPARSLDFELRPTSVPGQATVPTNPTGSLQVASRPSGAQVFVDDDLIGTTPLLLSNVAVGSRSLRIELLGYKIWTRSVPIEPSARFRVTARLEP